MTPTVRLSLSYCRRENPRLRQERDILAKAAAWLARDLQPKVADLIRKDEHFFCRVVMLYIPGNYGPAVRAALDFRLDQISHHLPREIEELAVISGSDHAKQRLIEMLAVDDIWAFWPVCGLLTGWEW